MSSTSQRGVNLEREGGSLTRGLGTQSRNKSPARRKGVGPRSSAGTFVSVSVSQSFFITSINYLAIVLIKCHPISARPAGGIKRPSTQATYTRRKHSPGYTQNENVFLRQHQLFCGARTLPTTRRTIRTLMSPVWFQKRCHEKKFAPLLLPATEHSLSSPGTSC